ncbi:MAG: SDR family oxidoreductase [Thermodesulfobacteriota bacterium]
MDLGLTGRIALVCGGSKGLGRAAATALAKEGAKVIIAARGQEALNQAAADITNLTGAEVTPVSADLSDPEQARLLARSALSAWGRVDVLINNAGGPPAGLFLDFSDQDWEAAIRLNFLSAVVLTRELVPGMKERRWGRVINFTSIAVKQPIDGLILSNAVRAAVHGWAKSLSNELAAFGVTVNNVLPGYTLTERVRNLSLTLGRQRGVSPEKIIEEYEAQIPMNRLGRPEDFGHLAAFLASDLAGYITGASIPIDGGYYKGLM